MNKEQIITIVAERTGMTKKDTRVVVETTIEAMREGLISEGSLSLFGFGKLEVKERKERKGTNPQTGEELIIKASNVVRFKTAKALKEELNQE